MRNWKNKISVLLMLTLLAGLIAPTAGQRAVAAAGDPPLELLPTADAFVSSGSPAANYNLTWLQLKGTSVGRRVIYMKYDLASLADIDPDSIEKVEALLKKTGVNGTTMTVDVRDVPDSTWTEGAINWSNAPAYGSEVHAQQTVLQEPDVYYSFDITNYLKTKLQSEADVLSFAYVASSTLNETMEFHSRTATSANTPKLIVTFAEEEDPGNPEEPTGLMRSIGQFGADNSGNIRVVEFGATPSASTGNGAVGITAHGAEPEDGSDLPIAVAFGTDGKISAVNGNAFGADHSIDYAPGQRYQFKIAANIPLQTYDVWVTQPGNTAPTLLAANYRLASGTQLTDIGHVFATADAEESDVPLVADTRLIQNEFFSTPLFSTSGGEPTAVELESGNVLANRSVDIKFDFKILGDPKEIDASVSYASGERTVAGFADVAQIVRSNFGVFDVRNDGTYEKDEIISTESNTVYHVKMSVRPDSTTGALSRRYDVWVAREGDQPVLLASNYRIRNFSNPNYALNDIGKIRVYSAGENQLQVSNHLILDGEQLTEAIQDVNAAASIAAMTEALESNALALPMTRYALMSSEQREQVAEDVRDARPVGGYINDLAIQSVFASSVINRLDTELPTPPTDVQVVISPSLQAKINWTAATDDTEIVYYKVLRDNVEIGTVYTGTSFTDFHIEPETTYTYAIKAYDLVLKEASSEPFVAVSPSIDELTYFPFSGEAISTAFHQPLLKYRLEAHPSLSLQWIMEWKEEYESSANALKLLALAATYDPDYLGPDGVTTVTDRALEQIRSVIAGGNEPGIAGNGLSAQGYGPVLEAFTIAKLKAPSIWNELTTAEKAKLDILMKAGLYGAKFAYDDENDNKTGIDASGEFDKLWNPNHRAGLVGALLAVYYFEDTDLLNTWIRTFDYDDWMDQLTEAGFTNLRRIYQNSGKALLEQEIRREVLNDGFTYQDFPLSQPGQWMKSFFTLTFGHTVSPVGGYDTGAGQHRGYMISGRDDLPNLGADGMAYEFNTNDAAGKRSSLTYVYMGWKPNMDAMLALQLFDNVDSGLSAAEMNELMLRFNVGTTDMLYKNEHGYMTFSLGTNRGVLNLDGAILTLNLDIWNNIMNNPLEEMAALNAATNAAAIREAMEEEALTMVLYGYNALTEAGQLAVAERLLNERPVRGYANKAAAQAEIYEGVREQAMLALDNATTPLEIRAALESRAMGIYMPKYDNASEERKQVASELLLANKPASGYVSKTEIREEVEASLEPQGNQLRNLPPVAVGESRFNVADYNGWPSSPGDAAVALWEDNKTGAFSLNIDDNFEEQHDVWRDLADQYGFKFSWFVITNNIVNIDKWKLLAQEGHDIASHTVTHHANGHELDDATMRQEYENSQNVLNQIEGLNAKTIAYPYGNGKMDLAAEYYIGARGTVGLPNYADNVNYMMTQSLTIRPTLRLTNLNASDNSAEAMVKTLIDPEHKVWGSSYYRGWSNMLVHSLNESGLNPTTGQTTNSLATTEYLLELLDDYRDQIWVGTYTDIVMYSQQRDTAQLTVTHNDDNEIRLALTDRMDDDLFDYPLTVKVRVDNAWEGIEVVQNGAAVPFTEVMREGNAYLLIKAVPDRGAVSITHAGSEEPAETASATLTADVAEAAPGGNVSFTIGVKDATSGFTAVDVIVNYDSQMLEFATEQESDTIVLADHAIESLNEHYTVASAVKSGEGQIRLLLFTNSNSHALTGAADLIRLNASVKQGATYGATGAVFLSDFEISLDGAGVAVDVSQATIVIAVGEEEEVPVPANKSVLIAAIAQVQAAYDKARPGDKIGEYSSTAKSALNQALNNAKSVRDNDAVGQGAVDSAVTALQAAYTAFTAAFIALTEGATAVSIRDLSIIAQYFGIGVGHPDWHKVAAADINDEGEITIEVLATVARMILDDWASGV